MLYKILENKGDSTFYPELEKLLLDGWSILRHTYTQEGYAVQMCKPEPEPLEIKVKYFVDDFIPIIRIEGKKSDWIDLRAAERVVLRKGDYYKIRLGIGMILPEGYEAHVLPRSSTAESFGILLANSEGVIDNCYSGDTDEWSFPAVAIRDTIIEKNDRICQFRIEKNQPEIIFKTVEHLNEVSRGGIGSTGKR